jgi:hypothetical protein
MNSNKKICLNKVPQVKKIKISIKVYLKKEFINKKKNIKSMIRTLKKLRLKKKLKI